MNYLQALLLGALQGVAEFLPVSSSGHLLIGQELLGLSDVPLLFDIALHVATLGAVLLVFRARIAGILVSLLRWIGGRAGQQDADNLGLVAPLLAGTVVTAAAGFLIKDIELSTRVVSGLFLATAALLVASSFLGGAVGYRDLGIPRGLAIGLAQGISVLPGVSRSGTSIAAGLAVGLRREVAGEYAFLISIPAILGALILELPELGTMSDVVPAGPLALGMAVAFAVGVASLKLLMPIVRRGKLAWFAVYLVPAGILGLVLLP
ncbi:MAG: undecaprenyl-diphosphate phosphatase [Spirochaetales bacterium]|nr:undecaprenyl-diphosphate phosphatase [Spirochaetales bacterium]